MAAGQEQCADGHHALANPRYQKILRATVLTFARYGYRKTPMNAGAHAPT